MISFIKRRFTNHAYFLFIPIMIVFFIFNILPLVISLILSFFKWSGGKNFEFLGIENYIFLLTEDTYFFKAANASLMILFFGVLPQHLIAVYNWSSEHRDVCVSLQKLRLKPGISWQLLKTQRNRDIQLVNGSLLIKKQPPHSVRIAGLTEMC